MPAAPACVPCAMVFKIMISLYSFFPSTSFLILTHFFVILTFSVFLRGGMIILSEFRGEVISASEAHIQSDLSYGIVRFQKEPGSLLQPKPLHVFHKGHMEILTEEPAEIALAHGQVRRQIAKAQLLGIMLLHKPDDIADQAASGGEKQIFSDVAKGRNGREKSAVISAFFASEPSF